MEKRLKQQRNRLFRRVGLIFFAVCVAVSAIYCLIRVYLEKISLQNQCVETISQVKQTLSSGLGSPEHFLIVLQTNTPLFEPDLEQDLQIIVTDQETKTVVLNTAGKAALVFGFRIGTESLSEVACLLDREKLVSALGDDRVETILRYLRTQREDGRHYELICTKFHIQVTEFVPLELQLTLAGEDNEWFSDDEVVETFTLDDPYPSKGVYHCNDVRRNSIPLDFLTGEHLDPDYISPLTAEQQEQPVAVISSGEAGNIIYVSDTMALQNDLLDPTPAANHTSYFVQFAERVNFWQECHRDLLMGVPGIFGFFLVIAVILCVMIWKMVKTQILQEQKRTDLTNALAHDIKTPLFVISGYAYSLKETIDEEERDTYLEKIIEQSEEINTLVHRMLDLSKLDSYTMTLHPTEFDLLTLVQEIADSHPSLPDNKTLTLSHSGKNTVKADRELIRTVLQNLTDNALLYAPPGSEIKIEVNGRCLCISNMSEPMSKAELKQLWQPYVRKDKSRHRKGNGLGLSIVKSILELHHADYDLQQKNGVFSVSFRLPE